MVHETESCTTIPLLAGQVTVSRPCHTNQLAVQGDIFCTSKSEGVYPQECRLGTPRLSRKWSGCPNVTFVCFVCLALSIHTYREKVNIIIPFMMVPFSLGWHRALYLQVMDYQGLLETTY